MLPVETSDPRIVGIVWTSVETMFWAIVQRFDASLADTLRLEAPMHRLWHDLRSQALFEPAPRDDVAEIDASLEAMIWRVVTRFRQLAGKPCAVPRAVCYATLDGLFQQALLKHVGGDPRALARLGAGVRAAVTAWFEPVPTTPARPARRVKESASPESR